MRSTGSGPASALETASVQTAAVDGNQTVSVNASAGVAAAFRRASPSSILTTSQRTVYRHSNIDGQACAENWEAGPDRHALNYDRPVFAGLVTRMHLIETPIDASAGGGIGAS